jgi:hypothetical protein
MAPAEAVEERAVKMYTLETAPGETVEVTEDEKIQMIDVGAYPSSVDRRNADRTV